MNPRRAAVLGSGFGGLALAVRLQAAGIQTTLVEQRDKPGGRAYVYENEDFKFDGGPTVITAPECLESVFRAGGREMSDYVEMLRRPEIAWAAAAFFMMFLGVSIYVIYLPTWLERDLGITGDQIAIMFLIGGIANVLTGPQVGKLSDRVGRKGIILLGCVGLSILMLATVRVISGRLSLFQGGPVPGTGRFRGIDPAAGRPGVLPVPRQVSKSQRPENDVDGEPEGFCEGVEGHRSNNHQDD